MLKKITLAVIICFLSTPLLLAQTNGNTQAPTVKKMGLPIDTSQQQPVDIKVSIDKDGNMVQKLIMADGSTITVTVQKDGKSAEVLESNGKKHLLDMSNPKKMTVTSHNKAGDVYGHTIIEDTGRIVAREVKPNKNLEVTVINFLSKQISARQVWRHDANAVGKNGKKTPYLLESVDEYTNGKLSRRLHFHDDGTTIKKSQTFHKGGSSSVVSVDANGFVTATEEFGAGGQMHSLPVPKGMLKHSEPDYSKLIVDPVSGGSEPIGVSTK